MRNPPPRNLALEALLEERDHLRIQINLLEHDRRTDAATLERMRSELEEMESRIANSGRVAGTGGSNMRLPLDGPEYP
jgi:hypothetical protein